MSATAARARTHVWYGTMSGLVLSWRILRCVCWPQILTSFIDSARFAKRAFAPSVL